MKGKFIVFEGLDGSGKSTQFKFFCKRLREKGHEILKTREPTNEMIGNLIRKRLHSKNKIPGEIDGVIYGLLFYADRVEHNHMISNEIKNGKIVVSDRNYHSTLAYQKTQGINMEFLLDNLHKKLQENKHVMKPDITFIIDVPPEEAVRRIDGRDKKRVEIFEHREFLEKLRENYLELKNILDENIEIIDGVGSIEEVQERVWKRWKKHQN